MTCNINPNRDSVVNLRVLYAGETTLVTDKDACVDIFEDMGGLNGCPGTMPDCDAFVLLMVNAAPADDRSTILISNLNPRTAMTRDLAILQQSFPTERNGDPQCLTIV